MLQENWKIRKRMKKNDFDVILTEIEYYKRKLLTWHTNCETLTNAGPSKI